MHLLAQIILFEMSRLPWDSHRALGHETQLEQKMGSNNRDNKESNICSVLRIKGCIPLGWSASGSEITRIVVDQMNRWIHSGQGFIGSVYLSLSEWSQITDPDLDHPKGKHPKCTLKSDLVSKKQQLQKEDEPVWEYNSKWRSDHHSNIVIAI